VEVSTAALPAGKHVLCEKPVAATLAGLDAIAQAQKEGGGVFSGVFQLMFGRGARPVRLLLDEGKLGRLHLGIADTLWFRDRDYYEEVPWRGSWERECGGVTSQPGDPSHRVALVAPGEPASVYAQAGVFRTRTETDDGSVAVPRSKTARSARSHRR